MTGEQFLILAGVIYLSHDATPEFRRAVGIGTILMGVWLGLTKVI